MHGFNGFKGFNWINRRRLAWRLGAAWSACLLLAAATLAAPEKAPAPVLIRFSHVVAHDTPKGQMALRFKALVQERSGGRLRVEVYPDSQLYGDDDEMEALQLGAVEMLAPSLSKFGAVGVPEFEVFDLPFLFHDLAQVRCVTQGPTGRQLLERLSRQQMVGLGFLDNGFKQMSAGQPVQDVQDFRGLRLRVQASRVLTAQMRSLGAYPVVLPFGETQRALAAGVVDGAENPLSNFLTQHLDAVQRDVTLTSHGYLGYAVVSNPRFWASLDDADRDLLTLALNDALDEGNRLSARMNQQALATLRESSGVRLHALSAGQRSAMRRAVQPAYDDFQRRVGRALLRQVQRDCLFQDLG
ncbi:DctP family TRAP transporter solute-binding subunit [Polaromonas hydrogenivorans]